MEQVIDDNPAFALSLGALAAGIHAFRTLVNRGLASPNEVEMFYTEIAEAVHTASPEMAEFFENRFQEVFAEMRQGAAERWAGKGRPDPEPSPSGRR